MSRGQPPRHFADLTAEERTVAVVGLGQPPFRAKQLATHYFTHLTVDSAALTDIPAGARDGLVTALFPRLLEPVMTVGTDEGATLKTLWSLHDGTRIESIFMRYPNRATLCVTSQVGCGMACPFCATGQMGLTRNLSAAEIIEQVRLTAQGEGRLTHVVFMGMGEPLANYRAVLSAIRTLVAKTRRGLGISARHVTVSTVGLVPAIDRLAGEGLPLTLALSLHAPDDSLRDELVPVNKRWTVDEALDAAHRYFETTHRRVSIEYALMRGINDQAWRADLLGEKLIVRGTAWAHVNLIPLNPTPGSTWTQSTPTTQTTFVRHLESYAIPVTIRDTRGSDIDGAYGQLATKEAT